MALRISNQGGGGGVRVTLRPSLRKLSLWYALLRLEMSKKLGLTEQRKPIRGWLPSRVVIPLGSR